LLRKYLIVDKYGSYLSVKDGRFLLRVKDGKQWKVLADASPVELDSIIILTEGVSLSAASLVLASEYGIDVVFFNGLKPSSRLIPATYGSVIWRWLNQLSHYKDERRRGELASEIVSGKIRNQAYVIRLYRKSEETSGRRRPDLLRAYDELIRFARQAETSTKTWVEAGEIEAAAARAYWSAVKTLIPKELGFSERLKKYNTPTTITPDPFNSALNIGYSALTKEVWRAVFQAGLNPYIGYLHERRAGRISLVYDLMEEFRPIAVDKPLIKLARRKPEIMKPLKTRNSEESRKAAREIWRTIIENLRNTTPPLTQIIRNQARKFAKAIDNKTKYTPYIQKY